MPSSTAISAWGERESPVPVERRGRLGRDDGTRMLHDHACEPVPPHGGDGRSGAGAAYGRVGDVERVPAAVVSTVRYTAVLSVSPPKPSASVVSSR